MKQILSVILGLLSFMSNGVSSCNVSAVNNCMLLLNSSLEVGSLHDGIAAIPTTEQLKQMCSNISKFKACYEPEAALCENDVIFSMTFGTIEKTISYLCREGYNGILQHSSCWSQPRVAEDTTMCHVQQSQMLASLQDLAGVLNSTDLRTVWCQILDNTTSCMTDAVSTSCEPGAQCIMRTMMTRSLSGLASFMKCPVTTAPATCSTTGITVTTLPPTTGDNSTSTPSNGAPSTDQSGQPGNQDDLRGRSVGIHLTDRLTGINTLLPFVTILYTLSVR